jgi:hypothetical protein
VPAVRPVEAPIATKAGIFVVLVDDAGVDTAAAARWAPLVSASTVRIFRTSGSAPTTLRSGANVGVATASSAPAPSASNTLLELPSTVAVTTMIGQGVSRMMRRVASTPSITGMIMSMSRTSGRSLAHSATASAPS